MIIAKIYQLLYDKRKGGGFMVTPLIVGNNFLKRGFEEGIEITPMKLQKLLYLLYARYYRCHDICLFSNQFEVWQYGPVIPEVYNYFKKFGAKGIDSYAVMDGETYEIDEKNINFSSTIDLVWDKYKHRTGTDLSNLTHEKNTAWWEANKRDDFVLSDEEIKKDGERFFNEC